MSAAWVAGSVRAQALGNRRLGTAGVRGLARSASLDDAVRTLASSPYGRHVPVGADLAQAQRGTADAVLWNLRVLAGWLPSAGVYALRILAGWFEIANVDEHLESLAGRPADPPFRLGMLGSSWSRLAATTSPAQMRSVLAESAWGDPGGDTPREIGLTLRAAWARRIVDGVQTAAPWALGATALLLARETQIGGRGLPDRAARIVDNLVGRGWATADSLTTLHDRLPAQARWALHGVEQPAELWRGEVAWWNRLRSDALGLVAGSGFAVSRAVGVAALLAADAWLVRAALEAAARPADLGGVFDVLP